MWVHYSANRDSRSHGFDGYSGWYFYTFEIEPQAIGIGPGLGQAVETQMHCINFKTNKVPLVIDADALNILSKIKNGFL
jgi:NAD(P)H-hydrate repair Nnr-like enzyme with NAD(P)H-hydrate dehydratase domain